MTTANILFGSIDPDPAVVGQPATVCFQINDATVTQEDLVPYNLTFVTGPFTGPGNGTVQSWELRTEGGDVIDSGTGQPSGTLQVTQPGERFDLCQEVIFDTPGDYQQMSSITGADDGDDQAQMPITVVAAGDLDVVITETLNDPESTPAVCTSACAPAQSRSLESMVSGPKEPCCEGGAGGSVTIDSSCEAPVFVEVCNPDTQPVQVISETEQLGCVTDAEGNVTGRVYFVPTFDADGNMTGNRMIMVATDGTVTDPYTGGWVECVGGEGRVDVELNPLCVLNPEGSVVQEVLQEIVYDQDGNRVSTRLVDRVTGAPAAVPGGTTLGRCPTEQCPTAFSTECFEDPSNFIIYDNGGGSDPSVCGAPSSGPEDANGPFINCNGNYLITSWIVDGAEQIVDPVPFQGQICGETDPDTGEIGFHADWARALNLLDGGAGWYARHTEECAWHVAVENSDRDYGRMVIEDADDGSRVWVINVPAVAEDSTMYTRVFQQDCDGAITSVWLDADGNEVETPQGDLQPCGMTEGGSCVTCETLVLCDTINNPDPTEGTPWNVVEIEEDADDPEHILHFHMSPADDPTKVGVVTFQSSTPFNTGGCDNPEVDYAISNPSRRTITLDEVAQEMHAFQFNMIDFDTFEPTYIPTGFPIPTRLGGTAYWTGEPGNNVNILPTESDGTGLLIWDNPPEMMAIQVGNTGGGNSCSNVDFEALTLSTMNRPFLRTICRDCEGNIVSITDTDMDGVTPYEPVGEVTACLASGENSSNEQPPEPAAQEVFMDVVRIQDAVFDPGSVYDNVQSVTLTVLSGEVVVSANTQQPTIPAGVSLTWSVQKDQDSFITPPQFDSSSGGDFILNVTYLGA